MIQLLFDKSRKGNEELKEVLGFIDAKFTFANFRPDLYLATLEMTKLISRKVYQEVLDSYNSESPDNELLFRVRYPIAVLAYLSYAKINDLSHKSDGRTVRLDDNEKISFEWQIDKNNAALERKYYKALDILLEYLDATNDTWKTTENYTKAHKTLIQSTSDFADIFPLDSRYLFLKLEPGLVSAEQFEIIPRIGNERLENLKAGKEKDSLIFRYVRYAMVYKSLSWAMRLLPVNIFPEGVIHSYLVNKDFKEKRNQSNESSEAYQQFNAEADRYLLYLEEEIKKEDTPGTSEGTLNYDFGFDDSDNFVTT